MQPQKWHCMIECGTIGKRQRKDLQPVHPAIRKIGGNILLVE